MKNLKNIFVALVLLSSSVSFGEDMYDSWNCRERDMLKAVGLQCVSCGIQDYYSKKGEPDVVPSEKWLALLGTGARAFRQLANKPAPRTNGRSTDEQDAMKKVIINQIQTYGFCTRYISKKTQESTKGKNYKNLSADEWNVITPLLSKDPNDDEKSKLGKLFGFKSLWYGKSAGQRMREFIDDADQIDTPTIEKRRLFTEKLKSALMGEFDVSGEQRSGDSQTIASEPNDNGLRACLEEVQERLRQPEYQTTNYDMCLAMTAACGMSKGVCGEPKKAAQSPAVKPGNPPPPPPPGARSGGATQ